VDGDYPWVLEARRGEGFTDKSTLEACTSIEEFLDGDIASELAVASSKYATNSTAPLFRVQVIAIVLAWREIVAVGVQTHSP
jgi:hypothetical protein